MPTSPAPTRQANQRGVSLVELIVTVALMAMMSVAVYQFTIATLGAAQNSRLALAAAELIGHQVEIVRNLPYADVGVVGGIPDGVLEHVKTVTVTGMHFTVTTTVRNVDDPFDGTIGGVPNDTSPADYKLVEVEVACGNCKVTTPFTMSTTAAPKGLETASTNGALFIRALNADGDPVAGADVHIVNAQPDPDIVIDDITDAEGWLRVIDAPPGNNAYAVTVSKAGYSTERTYAVGDPVGNAEPTKPHVTILTQQVTQVTFGIDALSTVNVASVYDNCSPVPNIPFTLTGGKTIGDSPVIYKYEEDLSTDGSGLLAIANMEWDSYFLEVTASGHELRGTTPVSPIALAPGTVLSPKIVLAPKIPKSLLVTVKDQQGQPVDGAAVGLTQGNALATQTTDADFGAGTFTDTAVTGSGTGGSVVLATDPAWLAVSSRGGSLTHTTDADFGGGTFSTTAVAGSGQAAGVELYGQAWGAVSSPQSFYNYNDVSLVSASFGMAVGNAPGGGSTVAEWDGSSWSSVSYPQTGRDLYAVELVSTSDGWAVGERASTMARWNGFSWVNVSDVSNWGNSPMYDVDCYDADRCLLVGYDGYYSSWDGSSWSSRASTGISGNPDLLAVTFYDSTHVIVAAANGALRLGTYSGGNWSWSNMSSGTSTQLNSVSCVSASSCFAVGENGVIRRWNGSSWSSSTSGTSEDIKEVVMQDAASAVAVAESGAILRWDGTSWSADVSNTTRDLYGVAFASASLGFAVGEAGAVIRWGDPTTGTFTSPVLDSGTSSMVWNNISWTASLPAGTGVTFATRAANTSPPSGSFINSTVIDAATASIPSGGGTGRYLQYRVTFTTASPPTTPFLEDVTLTYNAASTNQLNAVDLVSANDGWAVGASGAIRRWNGFTWSSFASPTTNSLFGVKMTSATNGFSVGEAGTIIRWNGTSWSTVSSPTGQQLNAVDLVSANDGWAVGEAGTIIRWNGTSWSNATSPTTNALNGVSLAASGDAWAVGDGNAFVRLSGSTWSSAAGPFTSGDDLYAVRLYSSSNGQAFGKGGIIARWDGATWSSVASPVGTHLYAADFLAADDAWAVGAGGATIHWDGATWTATAPVTDKTLRATDAVTADDAWAVGASDTVTHLTPQYLTGGTFVSAPFDAGVTVPWYMLSWSEIIPSGAGVTLATRTGDALPLAGAWSAETGAAGGSPIASGDGRYLQYRLTMTNTDQTSTPQVGEVTATYGLENPTLTVPTGSSLGGQSDWSDGPGLADYDGTPRFSGSDGSVDYATSGELTLAGGPPYAADGYLTSSTFDVGAGAVLGSMLWLPTSQPAETGASSVKFQVAANNDNATWDYLGPDGTAGTYYTASGTALAGALAGNRYFRYRAYLSTADSGYTPTVEAAYLTYTPACAPSGQALFQGLAAGNYKVTVTKAGYAPYENASYNVSADWIEMIVNLTSS